MGRLHKYKNLFNTVKEENGTTILRNDGNPISVLQSPTNVINYLITNVDPTNSYTYRFFGSNTGLPTVDNNNYLVNNSNLSAQSGPFFSAICTLNNYLYVPDKNAGTVTVIDTNRNQTVTNITVGNSPYYAIAAGRYVYVSNFDDNTVSVINPITNTVIKTIAVGINPQFMGANADGTKIYVNGQFDMTSTVINTTTNTVITTLNLGVNPRYCTLASNGYLYIGSFNYNTVTVINTNTDTVLTSITTGSDPYYIFYFNGNIYANSIFGDTITVINPQTNTVSATINTGGASSYWSAYNPTNNTIYVSDILLSKIYSINATTNTVTGTINPSTPGCTPTFIVYSSIQNYFFVSNNTAGTIDVFNSENNTIVNTITAGAGTHFAIQAPNGNLYFSNNGTNTVTSVSYITPVTIIVNGGASTVSQVNTNIGGNAAIINTYKSDTSTQTNINTPLEKYYSSGAGGNNQSPVSLLKQKTSFETPTMNIALLERKDFEDPIIDGFRYIQHVIAPSSTISLTITYNQAHKPYGSDADGNLIFIEDLPKRKIKKYMTAQVRVFKED